MRSQLCAEISQQAAGDSVTLCGWVDARRDLGGLIFLGLRDHSGIIQIVIEPESPAFADAERLRNEYCVQIEGKVRASALKKIEEIVERHPEETVGILRHWMSEDAK